ncbi:hypothetical protein ACWGIP_07705, partial [Streptomyces sp. NPDC054838]
MHGERGATVTGPGRVTWVQPEDLVGHELRQAAQDGRDAEPLLRVWLAAGGHPAPERAGASPVPAGPELRELACRLLTRLAALPCPSAPDEPESWQAITATWNTPAKAGPPPRPWVLPGPARGPRPGGRRPAPTAAPPPPPPAATPAPQPSAHPGPHPGQHPVAQPATRPRPSAEPDLGPRPVERHRAQPEQHP